MRRGVWAAALMVLVAAACGNGDDPAAPTSTTPATSTTSTTSGPAASSPTKAPDDPECPQVIAVELVETAPGTFNVSATVRSNDVTGVSYADAWEVRDLDGAVLGTRVLTHPHTNEQPCPRSLSSVSIGATVLHVEVEAKDSVDGFCGSGLVVEVPHQ